MEKDKDKRTADIIPNGITVTHTNGSIAASLKGGSAAGSTSVSLGTRSLERWLQEAKVMNSGMIMICRTGSASIRVNFSMWKLSAGSVITLFPNDMVTLTERSEDFSVEVLEYSATLLREASLQMEQTVYSQLRADRCRTESPIVTNIINGMFTLLKIYFDQPECMCLDQLVLLQLKAFFVGFYDYIYRFPQKRKPEEGSPRARELFNLFMMYLETHFKESRDVTYYASLLNITPKYLNMIAQRITGNTVKALINEYVVMQLKLSLCSGNTSMKILAGEYNFSDLSFFCRYFKQHTGMTPMQFVKSEAPKKT